jgi:HK97 family phage prohead protease
MDRRIAYSLIEVKEVGEEQRVIRGTATTPEVDRVGDIVEPLGLKFKNPLPLLWQHQHDAPVGTVKFERPTADGVTFEASLPKIEEPGTLRDRIEEAWQSVKAKLVRGVSIGFAPLEYAFMDGGGMRFIEAEVYELSLVTIPANASATIQSIKSYDIATRAALGLTRSGPVRLIPRPGASGVAAASRGFVQIIPRAIKS